MLLWKMAAACALGWLLFYWPVPTALSIVSLGGVMAVAGIVRVYRL